jgi:hypothetical protein
MKKRVFFFIIVSFFLAAILLPCFPNSSYAAHCGMCSMNMKTGMGCQANPDDQGIQCSCCFFYSNAFTPSPNDNTLQAKVKLCSKFFSKLFMQVTANCMRVARIHSLSLQAPPRLIQSSLPWFLQISVLRL